MDMPKRLRKAIFARESEPKPQAAMIPAIESSVVVSSRQSFSNWTRWTESAGGYFHATGRRMKLPWVPTGIASGSWQRAGRSRGMFL